MTGRWTPHLIAAGITLPFAAWIAMSELRGVLSPVAWLMPLGAAYYLGLRIGREVVKGVRRARGDRGARWMPNDQPAPDEGSVSLNPIDPTDPNREDI